MPAKAPIDENVKFLFACLLRSDYKTIDFARVAADFSINPAAARMRWSRLKKSINSDDIASSVLVSPAKPKSKSPLKQLKEKEPKEKDQTPTEVKQEKRTERKAKVIAGQNIGIIVKGEVQPEDEGDEDDRNEDEVDNTNGQSNTTTALKVEDEYMGDNNLGTYQTPTDHPHASQPSLGLFHLTPSTPSLMHLTPSTPAYMHPHPLPDSPASPSPAPKKSDQTAFGGGITVKNEFGSSTNSAVDLVPPGSPTSSSSSFSPDSARTSASPPPVQGTKQPGRAPPKWRAERNSRVHKPRGKFRN